MTMTMSGSGAPRLQRSWDSRAACNFIGGGSGTGLLLAAALAFAAGWSYFIAGTLAIALIGFGLSMVWLEIGRPLRALNVFFHPQTSWMSREAMLALPILMLGALAVSARPAFRVSAVSNAFPGCRSCVSCGRARSGVLILPG